MITREEYSKRIIHQYFYYHNFPNKFPDELKLQHLYPLPLTFDLF